MLAEILSEDWPTIQKWVKKQPELYTPQSDALIADSLAYKVCNPEGEIVAIAQLSVTDGGKVYFGLITDPSIEPAVIAKEISILLNHAFEQLGAEEIYARVPNDRHDLKRVLTEWNWKKCSENEFSLSKEQWNKLLEQPSKERN